MEFLNLQMIMILLIPAHPRLKDYVDKNKIDTSKFKVIDPQPYIKVFRLS